MDLDLRGLDAKHREAFWIGMAAAFDRLREWDQAASFSHTVAAVRLIHAKGAGRPDVVNETDVAPVDLGDLWFSE